MIDIRNLSISYDKKVIDDISFSLKSGLVNVLMGRNGSGKSSILNAISGLVDHEGEIKKTGEISYLNQNVNTNINFTVFETILLGKVKNLGLRISESDIEDVDQIIDLLDIGDFKEKPINRLSGGEVQKVLIGQALIKKPEILLLDEPASALDLKNQYQTLELISNLTRKLDITTLITIHQIDLIEKFADNIILINNGKIYRQGDKYQIFDKQMFEDIYGLDAIIRKENNKLMFYFSS